MSKRIAIVGAGVGGLHLGLYLRARGVDATIHTDRRPEEYAKLRLLNSVAHHSITVARESELGVDHWPVEQHGYYCHHHHFGGEQPLFFRGDFKAPSRALDYRIYLKRLMQDFAERGGRIEYGELKSADIARVACRGEQRQGAAGADVRARPGAFAVRSATAHAVRRLVSRCGRGSHARRDAVGVAGAG
jgi:hypothetical protein